eukprot:702770_1
MSRACIQKRLDAYYSNNSRTMNVNQIRFTQPTIKNTFSNGVPIEWTIDMLETNQVLPIEIPLIRVGYFRGQWKSIDNRRLYCYKTAKNIKQVYYFLQHTVWVDIHETLLSRFAQG